MAFAAAAPVVLALVAGYLTQREMVRDPVRDPSTQDPAKATCQGDPQAAASVRIRVSDKEDLQAGNALVWFDGQVALNELFEMSAANAGKTKFKAHTWVHIFDPANALLQTIQFHTSCSQPLNEGDIFGSLTLEGFTAE